MLDSPGDPFAMQRVLVKDAPLPPGPSGPWEIDLAAVEGEGTGEGKTASLRLRLFSSTALS